MDSSWLSLSSSSPHTAMEVPDEPASWSWAELSSSPLKLVDFLGGGNGGGEAPSLSHSHQQGQEDKASRRDTIAAALQHQQQLKIEMAAAAASAQEHFMFNGGGGKGSVEGGKQQQLLRQRRKTSRYRGVSREKGKFVAFLWDNSCKSCTKDGNTSHGTKVNLGRYDTEHMAAKAYDLAALKYRRLATHINFSVENYRDELEKMKSMTRKEFVEHLRMRAQCFDGLPPTVYFRAAEACDTNFEMTSHGYVGKVMESSTQLSEEDPHINETEMETGATDAAEHRGIDYFSSHRQ